MEEESYADESAYLKAVSILGFQGRRDILLPLPHRKSYIEYVTKGPVSEYWKTPEGEQELEYWNSPVGQDALKSIETPANMLQALTDLITKYSDKTTVECLRKEYSTLRDFFERSIPTTQCSNTVRSVNPQTTVCWICGGRITGYPGAGEFKALEITPECEHVFPIAQALCFAGLYETQLYNQIAENEGVDEAEAYRKGVTYEYQWAHRICNQIKNDTHFIRYDGNRFSIDETLIDVFLRDLQTTKKYGGGALLMKFVGQSPTQWIEQRKKAMKDISNLLINYANTSGLTPEQHAKVTLMAIRSYIATDNTCAGAVEVIPNVIVQTGRTSDLPTVSMSEPVAASKHFIGVVVEETSGFIDRVLSSSGRTISARDKGLISAWLLDTSVLLRSALETRFTVLELNAIRLKVMYYLKQKNLPPEEAWSNFQVWTTQVIGGAIYSAAGIDGLRFLQEKSPDQIVTQFLTSQPLRSALEGWVKSKIAIVNRGGVPYQEIIVMNPSVDPLPDVPNPPWFQMPAQRGGGDNAVFPEQFSLFGGLRARRSLYSNVEGIVVRNNKHSRLRERARTRRTPRVRQSTRKSKTRR